MAVVCDVTRAASRWESEAVHSVIIRCSHGRPARLECKFFFLRNIFRP